MQPLNSLTSMLKFILKTIVLSLLASTIAVVPLQLHAQTTNKASAAVKKSRSTPFYGNLMAIDKTAKTFKVDKRIIQITSETKIIKADKPATLDNAVLGEYITGSYQKADDGRLLAHSIYFGGKTKTTTDTKK